MLSQNTNNQDELVIIWSKNFQCCQIFLKEILFLFCFCFFPLMSCFSASDTRWNVSYICWTTPEALSLGVCGWVAIYLYISIYICILFNLGVLLGGTRCNVQWNISISTVPWWPLQVSNVSSISPNILFTWYKLRYAVQGLHFLLVCAISFLWISWIALWQRSGTIVTHMLYYYWV